jgi:hypothetical protein
MQDSSFMRGSVPPSMVWGVDPTHLPPWGGGVAFCRGGPTHLLEGGGSLLPGGTHPPPPGGG